MSDRRTAETEDGDGVVVGEVVQPLALVRGTRIPPQRDRTLADLIAEVILRGKSPRTRAAYRSDLQDFLVWLLGRSVELPTDPTRLQGDPVLADHVNAALAALQQVAEGDVQSYLRHLIPGSAEGLKPATVNRRLTPLRLLFSRLQRYHLIAVNPMEFVKGHRLGNMSTTLWLSKVEARALEETCGGGSLRDLRDRALVMLMLSTGIRSSEALGLEVTDLQMLEGHHVAWLTGKGGARERVKVPPRVRHAIDAYLAAGGISAGPIFRRLIPRAAGTPRPSGYPPVGRVYSAGAGLTYVGLKSILRARFKAAGLDKRVSPHSLRHSFVTLALRGGASLPKVQAAARHASPQTTIRYAHGLDDLDDNAVDYVKW